MQKGKE